MIRQCTWTVHPERPSRYQKAPENNLLVEPVFRCGLEMPCSEVASSRRRSLRLSGRSLRSGLIARFIQSVRHCWLEQVLLRCPDAHRCALPAHLDRKRRDRRRLEGKRGRGSLTVPEELYGTGVPYGKGAARTLPLRPAKAAHLLT